MKKLIQLYILLGVLFTSCLDLNRYPNNELSEETFWKTIDDAKLACTGCYNGWEDFWNILWYDGFTDNAFSQFPWDGIQIIGQGMHDPFNTGRERWQSSYKGIRKCNDFLKRVDDIEDSELLNRLIGEVRFLRSYHYFILTQFYGDVPLVTETLNLDETHQPRDPKDEVVKFILSELEEASKVLPYSYSGNDEGRMTKGAAMALKARIELFEEMYKEAANTANEIISNSEYGYDLFPNYEELFWEENENNEEVIFDVQYVMNDLSHSAFVYHMPKSSGGWSSICPVQKLVDAYETTDGKTIDDPSSIYDPQNPFSNRDSRLAATIIYPGTTWKGAYYNSLDEDAVDYYANTNASKSGYNLRKYMNPNAPADQMYNTPINMIVCRFAEVLLTYAEAKVESDDIDSSVLEALNRIRIRSNMPEIKTQTKDELRKIIRRERRVELALEGMRWFDIKRWKIGNETLSGELYGSRLGTVDESTGEISLEDESIFLENRVFDEGKNYLWPIPQRELDLNDQINENNPGY